ncbi:suppressor of fused domain protein [Burkholderia glumae]|uniref:suppressor of fused domain protein n=1 Tax=Burkholderia glumae TaxID=337 RepID=UPI000F5FCD9C|nr:suppressor of fused domain protein [Burkholderia glumae]MCQ0032529.1 suppressor of fused domain protein [Burkholderia glumae]MCQ0039890.1 suppressor of fused domain protein [Burkholderia glumae]MCR1766940.1 suppressor of fused domain protein [Burkholderia glumae]QHP90909.1 suppressor of fused domain protein [Burkholderia glumae]QJW79489.1 suppressor of fused domain protein [Burkholderia glumae]
MVAQGNEAARQAVARHVMTVFDGMPKAQPFSRDARELAVLSVADAPDEDVVSYSTAGLCEFALDTGGFDTRIELCGAMPDDVAHWPDILAAAAFELAAAASPVRPGVVVREVVARCYPKTTVPHLYLSIPFIWNDGAFPECRLDGMRINWLQCFPVSDEEARLASELGADRFESRLDEAGIDTYDLRRKSL